MQIRQVLHVGFIALAIAIVSLACGSSSTGSPAANGQQSASTPAASSGSEVGYKVGNLAPDFTLTMSDGQKVTLSSLREQGEPVVLYFFTTW